MTNASKKFQFLPQSGFTVVELMVVVAIMSVMALILTLNLNGQRAARDVKIAQTKLVTDIRKIQSYTLSARLLSNGQSAQYYLIKFDLTKPNQYVIQAVYNSSSQPQIQDIEVVTLPSNVNFAATQPILIDRSLISDVVNPGGGLNAYLQTPATCSLLGFAVPFGKVLMNDGCATTGSWPNINTTDNNDDYNKILTFVSNQPCISAYKSPPGCTLSSGSQLTVTVSSSDKKVVKQIMVNGITGAVTFN